MARQYPIKQRSAQDVHAFHRFRIQDGLLLLLVVLLMLYEIHQDYSAARTVSYVALGIVCVQAVRVILRFVH